jgi:hypothetical protein
MDLDVYKQRWVEEHGYIWLHTTLEGARDNLWTLPFGLSQFHCCSSWFVCEVAALRLNVLKPPN